MEKIVVTRYKALVDYLRETGLVDESTRVIPFAQPEDIEGKHVIGVLPYWLACYAGKITEVQLRVPIEKKGKELTLEEVRLYSLIPRTFVVKQVPFAD